MSPAPKSKFGGVPLNVTPSAPQSQFGGQPLPETSEIPGDFSPAPPDQSSVGKRYATKLMNNLGNLIPNTVQAVRHPVEAIKSFADAPYALADKWNSGQRPEALADLTMLAFPSAIKGAGKLLQRGAVPVAEGAVGIRKIDRGYGRTPGKSILTETRGVTPERVGESAQGKLNVLRPKLEAEVNAAPGPASIQPALDVIDAEIAKATTQNAAGKISQLQKLRATLSEPVQGFSGNIDPATGQILPAQSPRTVLDLKRGFSDEHISNWNPETMHDVRGTAGRVYGALDTELDRTVPAARDLNQQMSSLIPVVRRAESTSQNATLPQRVTHRLAAHTGAAVLGAAGYHYGGIGGAAAGLVLPELISSPTGQMIVARAMHAIGKGAEITAPGAVVPAAMEASQPSIAKRLGQEVWRVLGGPGGGQ